MKGHFLGGSLRINIDWNLKNLFIELDRVTLAY